jgi:hypothetical protein
MSPPQGGESVKSVKSSRVCSQYVATDLCGTETILGKIGDIIGDSSRFFIKEGI